VGGGPTSLEINIQHIQSLSLASEQGTAIKTASRDWIQFLQIKAVNKKFLHDVLSIKHTEELLLQVGWRPKVIR
jgi:hypothetical protein